MSVLKFGFASLIGGLCAAVALPATATTFPTLKEGNGFYTITNTSQYYVSTIFVSNPKAAPGLDSTTQPNWQAGYCFGCSSTPTFFFDAQSFQDEIAPGQTTSKFFFTAPPADGTYTLFLSNANDSDAGYISGAVSAPEPATWALMLVGFGTVGAMLRRPRRRETPIAA